jgi:hypothetical protein
LYALAAPLVAAHSALVLVGAQAVAGALVAPGLYEIARRRTGERAALGIAAAAWLYPPLAGVTFTDFHENGFVPAATVWLLWAIDARKLGAAAVFAVLLLATKEDQGLILAATGFGTAFWFARDADRERAWFGLGLCLASLATFAIYFGLIRPHFGGAAPWDPLHFYGLGGVESRGPTTPIFSFGRLTYLLEAFGPLLFVPLRSPVVLGALPGFAECLLSHESLTYTMGQHYAAVWIGYVLVAFALGAAGLPRWSRWGSLAACALVLAVASPTHWGHFLRAPDAHDALLDRFVAAVPGGAVVGTHDEIYAHLGFDSGAQIGLEPLPALALFDDSYRSTAWNERVRPQFEGLLARGEYRIVRSEGGVRLAERIRTP